jgi:hypothetical protein
LADSPGEVEHTQAARRPAVAGILVDVRLVEIDQQVPVARGTIEHRLEIVQESLALGRPSSFLAFFQDSFRRCSAARMVSRQNRRPKRCSTQCIRRRSVQRGGGARSGGRACWASPITPPSAASISRQRGGRYAPGPLLL